MKYLVLFNLFILSACVAPQPALKIYPGAEKPLAEVASIRGSNLCNDEGKVIGETRIVEINGGKASSFSSGYQRDLLINPGKVSVTVYWFYAYYRTEGNISLDLTAEKGHRYIVRANNKDLQVVDFFIEDLGPESGVTPFVHPTGKNGRPSNCY